MIDLLKQSKAFYRSGAAPPKWPDFYRHVTSCVNIDGLWLDFGTGPGLIMNNLDPYIPHKIYGFDWFGGLPEDWIVSDTETLPIGSFKLVKERATSIESFIDYLEKIHPKLTVVCGLFADTLPAFLQEHPEPCAFAHVDCDLYSSTKTILDLLTDRIVSGTVILFDEFYGYKNYCQHEYRAFGELIEQTGYRFEFIAHVADARQAAVIIR